MFEEAKADGLTWEVERSCRLTALRAIAALPEPRDSGKFFLNVSPEVFRDRRFIKGFTLAALTEYGLDQRSIVLEITERDSIGDHREFEAAIRHYLDQGFQVALDDFGSGHSGLVTLVSCVPGFLKLDMEITRDIDTSPYKQAILKSVVALASAINADLIAEGVETWRELETLVSHGVRFAQGWLLGRPYQDLRWIGGEDRNRLLLIAARHQTLTRDAEEAVGALCVAGVAAEEGILSGHDVIERFQKSPLLENLVLTRKGVVAGLVTRENVFAASGGAFGYALYHHKPASALAKTSPLCAAAGDSIHEISTAAMKRKNGDTYDPVIVVDEDQHYLGLITIKQLLTKSTELSIARAEDANPLTRLPGNREIRGWLAAALQRSEYTLVYADLDRFKEFNDRYGFVSGDDLLGSVGQLLTRMVAELEQIARVGHVGGDDFVIVSDGEIPESFFDSVCAEFDREKLRFFSSEDQAKGFFIAKNRAGETVQVPLTTLTLAVIKPGNLGVAPPHIALLMETAASLKRAVKKQASIEHRSGYLIERRTYAEKA